MVERNHLIIMVTRFNIYSEESGETSIALNCSVCGKTLIEFDICVNYNDIDGEIQRAIHRHGETSFKCAVSALSPKRNTE